MEGCYKRRSRTPGPAFGDQRNMHISNDTRFRIRARLKVLPAAPPVTRDASTARRLPLAVLSIVVVSIIVLGWFLPGRHWAGTLADRVRAAGAIGVIIFITAAVVADVALVP